MEEGFKQLFIGGDLSGIQSFLYNITSEKAAVSLKGRSFSLQQYMNKACERIKQAAKEAGAKSADDIYCSGGKFYILTDNSEQIVNSIDACAAQLKHDLWKEHMGQLGISISYVPFTEHEDGTVDAPGLHREKPGCLWRAVNAEFAKQKNQKFKDILLSEYKNFFEPIPVGGKPLVCAVTGIESPNCVKIKGDKGEPIYVLPSVKQQIQLGEDLRKQQQFKTFEDYADNTDLGILRMDLDNLGKRFVSGFNSIKEYQAFSERLDKFFKTEIEGIRQDKLFKEHLNIIYAGGDDLVVLGRWDKTIDFAERVQKEFSSRFPALQDLR